MKILIDLNVALDLFLDRTPWVEDAKKITAKILDGSLRGYVAAIDLPTLFYIAKKSVGVDRAFSTVRACVATYEIVPIGRSTCEAAGVMTGKDFEDNIHIAAAIEAGLDAIITRDAAGFAESPIPVYSPPDFLVHLGLGQK